MTSRSEAVDTLLAADAAWLKVFAAKDLAKSVGFFDEQGSMLVPHSPILTGKDAISEFIARAFALQDHQITWHPNQAGIAASGELGYTSGAYEMSFKDASGKPVSDQGKYLMVWKKQANGEWKVLFDMSNSDLPAPRS